MDFRARDTGHPPSRHDAFGCYPLSACQNRSELHNNLEAISRRLVPLSMVTDSSGEYDTGYLRQNLEYMGLSFMVFIWLAAMNFASWQIRNT